MNGDVARLTLRQLLTRRRILLLLLLGGLMVLVGLVYVLVDRGAGQAINDRAFASQLIDKFGLAVLMPLVALLLGTAALGAEIEDGTVVYLLAKPIPRHVIVLTKLLIAALGSVLLTCIPIFVTGLLVTRGLGGGVVLGFTIAAAVGSIIYCAVFLAFSLVTGRALIFGLLYVLVWEGLLAGLFAGTRVFSVRQQTLALADALADLPAAVLDAQLDLTTAVVVGAVVLVGATVLAVRFLQHLQISGETG